MLYAAKLYKLQKCKGAIELVASNIKLIDDKRIRIINKEGTDCLYNYVEQTIEQFSS